MGSLQSTYRLLSPLPSCTWPNNIFLFFSPPWQRPPTRGSGAGPDSRFYERLHPSLEVNYGMGSLQSTCRLLSPLPSCTWPNNIFLFFSPPWQRPPTRGPGAGPDSRFNERLHPSLEVNYGMGSLQSTYRLLSPLPSCTWPNNIFLFFSSSWQRPGTWGPGAGPDSRFNERLHPLEILCGKFSFLSTCPLLSPLPSCTWPNNALLLFSPPWQHPPTRGPGAGPDSRFNECLHPSLEVNYGMGSLQSTYRLLSPLPSCTWPNNIFLFFSSSWQRPWTWGPGAGPDSRFNERLHPSLEIFCGKFSFLSTCPLLCPLPSCTWPNNALLLFSPPWQHPPTRGPGAGPDSRFNERLHPSLEVNYGMGSLQSTYRLLSPLPSCTWPNNIFLFFSSSWQRPWTWGPGAGPDSRFNERLHPSLEIFCGKFSFLSTCPLLSPLPSCTWPNNIFLFFSPPWQRPPTRGPGAGPDSRFNERLHPSLEVNYGMGSLQSTYRLLSPLPSCTWPNNIFLFFSPPWQHPPTRGPGAGPDSRFNERLHPSLEVNYGMGSLQSTYRLLSPLPSCTWPNNIFLLFGMAHKSSISLKVVECGPNWVASDLLSMGHLQ